MSFYGVLVAALLVGPVAQLAIRLWMNRRKR